MQQPNKHTVEVPTSYCTLYLQRHKGKLKKQQRPATQWEHQHSQGTSNFKRSLSEKSNSLDFYDVQNFNLFKHKKHAFTSKLNKLMLAKIWKKACFKIWVRNYFFDKIL